MRESSLSLCTWKLCAHARSEDAVGRIDVLERVRAERLQQCVDLHVAPPLVHARERPPGGVHRAHSFGRNVPVQLSMSDLMRTPSIGLIGRIDVEPVSDR
ncbi:hypothetical protein FI667_g1168, partial [Globisporangium splendens]